MHKVFKSYSRKAERKYEHNGGAAQGDTYQRVQHENAGAPYVTSPPSSVRNGASAHHQQQQHQQQQHQQHQQQQQYDSYQRSTARDYSGRSAEYADSTYQRGGAGKEIIPTGDHRYHDQSLLAVHGQQGQGFSESSTYETKEHYEKKMVRKKTRGERERARKANGVHASNGSLSRQGFKVSEVLQAGDGLSARDALLQWAKKVTAGYPGVNVTNFTNSWRDGLAFNAILHRYRPNAVDWQRVSDKNVSNRERLRNAFDTADNEFGVAKLLDPEDVDRENPDEKSIITYVSSLYNALPNLDALSKGDLSDLKSRLARGIGITNEKLDLILKRIEDLEARIDTASPAEIERGIQGIVDDLNALEAPIQEFFEDVEILKQHNDPDANDFHKQVYGLHQRRTAYLDRMGGFGGRLGQRADFLRQEESERYSSIRTNAFRRVEEAIEWVRVRTDKLNNMDFNKDLETLEHLFEQHKLDNHDIQDFQQTVKECIARQAEVSAEDSYEYCELLKILESEYQQLRELSAGRVLDLDSLIAFIRAAQIELVWINEREEIEVTRNWSDINQLDLPMLQNYYKQLLHEIELREKQFNDVYNQGAALINQRHPAGDVIEAYLRSMQSQWDWLLGLSRCLEGHLRDALNLKSFTEEAAVVQEWLHRQLDHLENNYNRSDFSLEEGEQYLRELDELKVYIDKYQDILLKLAERSAQISPLWQRGERIAHPIPVTAWCDYTSREITIRAGDECVLLDNSDLIHWVVRGVDDTEAKVPSVVFRIPPPDPRIATLLKRLLADFEKLRKLWQKKHLMVRFNMVLNTMKNIQGWDLDTFLSLTPEQRDEIIKALNDDANKLLSELDPNDPLYLRLQEELKRTNDHFLDLLRQAQRGPEIANQFDEKLAELLKKLEEAWKKLNDRVGEPVPKTPEELERIIYDHKNFEEALQALDPEVSNVKELFRQLPNPTPTQRANMDHLSGRWEDLWDLSRMYVERLKALEKVLQGLLEVEDIVRRHEVTLSSFDDLPSALDKLRGVHSQLLELNMVLQQQEHLVHELNKNVAQLRQHVARTRFNVASHPDVDRLEDQVQQVTVRWDNVVTQVTERLKTAEESQQTQMVYRSQYDEEILWLDRVEATINGLRRPEDIPPEKLQEQLDILMAEYAQLQEHTATIENINKEGGKFIREAKMYDARTGQFRDNVVNIHGPTIKSEFRRQVPQPKNGAQIVTEELEALNRRFAQLSSIILERKNAVQVLIQNWKRKQQEEEERRRAEEEAKRRAFEAARLKALEDADRLRREREAAEAARRAAEEADRLRRERDAAEAARRAAEEAERRRREEEERRRREAEDAARRRAEEEERRRREEEERRRREAERLKPKEIPLQKADQYATGFPGEGLEEFDTLGNEPVKPTIVEHEDEMQTYQEETVTKTQFYEMEGVLHKQTGEILTFVEAIRQGLLDLSSGGGEFFDIVSGSRISLEKAAEMKLIGEDVNQLLQARHGIMHPETGEQLTLLEAIQIGLYDPEIRQLRDIHTGEILSLFDARNIVPMDVQRRLIKMGVLKLPPITLEQAIQQNVVNTETGHFTGKFSGDMPLKDALYNGYIQLRSQQIPTIAISLSDCLRDGFIDGHSGEFNDRSSNDKFTLRDALSRDNKLLNEHIREIVNTDTNQRITLADAILCHAINHRQGNFTDLRNRSSIPLNQAYNNDYISKPLTLTEVIERDLLDSTHRFIDRGTKNRFTLLEAIASGIVDPEVRHIVDPDEEDVVSIAEALERGLLEPDGRISLLKQQRTLSLHEAHHDGLLTKRVRHTIFDVKGIKNTETGENLSFNEAVEAGAIVVQAERIVDLRTKNSHLLSDASSRGIIDPMLQELLVTPLGIKHDGQELNLIRAVSRGVIDPVKGVFFDRRSNRELTPREAYESGQVTLRGALKLTGLFDVHPSLMTPIKKRERKRRIQRPGQPADAGGDQIKVTLAEAMKQGLIDSRSQRFRQGNQEMSLHDALSQGLIDPSSEWIVPSRSSAVGPTIEEKIQETVTETAQQLAPKVYPDQQVEETVSTVKRVKRTETSAVGGPGGVSVYRAITGSKGAIEVPSDGYHVREAERRGMVDLSSGVVTPPGTDRSLTLEEAFTLGVLNPNSISIKDPKSGRNLNALEAIEQKVMDKNGRLDHRGRRLTLQEAVEERIAHLEAEPPATLSQANKKIIQFSSGQGPVMSFRPVGQAIVEEHEQAWSFDAQSGQFVDLQSGQTLSIDRALESGKLSADDLRVRDALTGREMSFDEAQKWGIINLRDGYYLDKTNNQRYNFAEAARQQRVYPTGGVPENASDSVHTTLKIHTRSEVSKKEAIPAGSPAYVEYNISKLVNSHAYDASSGLFQPPDAQKQMTLKELIVKGYLNPYNTTIVDKRQRRDLKLLDAIDENIVDDVAGTVKDTSTGRTHDFASAVREGLVKESVLPDSYDASFGGQQQRLSVGEATQPRVTQSSSSYSPKIVERKLQLTPYSQEPQQKSSSRQGFVQTSSYEQDFRQPIASTHQPSSGVGQRYTSTSSYEQDFRHPTASTQPSSGTGQRYTSTSSYQQDFRQPTASTPPTSGAGVGSFVKNQVALMERGGGNQVQLSKDERYVDLGGGNQVKVKVVRGTDGVEKGEYFDPSTGMKFTIQLHGDPFVTQTTTKVRSTSQVQSIDLEPHAQLVGMNQVKDLRTGRVMSLDEAQRLGIARVDRKGKQATKSYSVFRSNIQLAVNKGVIDAHNEKISLEDAIKSNIVDITNLKYIHPKTNEPLDLTKAANMGLIDVTLAETLPKGVTHPANGENIPVRRAIDLGIINARSGEVRNPFTNERLTWIDLLKPLYASITMQGVYDPKKGYGVPISSAFNEGLIDTRSESYYNAITEERIPLQEASNRGLIDQGTYTALSQPFVQDYRTRRQLNLVQAVDAKLVDPRNRTIQLSADRIVPIAKAVEEGLVPREIGERLRRHDKLNFAEALGKGLIDVAQDTFTDPDTGKQLSIADAVAQGFVDTGNVDSTESNNNLALVIASDEFDERSGRIQDRRSGMHLTFRSAVEQGIIDPDSLLHDLESSKTMTIREALNKGLVDNDGKYVDAKTHSKISLNEAVKSGLVALIASPMQAAQAVTEAVKRREAEGYKFKIESLETADLHRQSKPKFREESHIVRLTPQRAEPGLSVRVRSSLSGVSDDQRNSRARSLIDDPLAQRELQDEFLDKLQSQNFNVDEKVLENPNTNLNVSIREAVETGLLDVLSGEIVHPRSLRRYTIPKAVHMRMLNPDAARRLMEALNMNTDELHQFSPASTTRVDYTSQYSPAGPTTQFSPASAISSENGFGAERRPSADRTSWSTKDRVISWQGNPEELRGSGGRSQLRTTTYTSPDGATSQHTSKYTTSSQSYQYP